MKLKIIFASISLLLMTFNIQAQKNYTISPSNTLKVTAKANILAVYDIYQNNISGSTIILKWKKISIDAPMGWDYSLCDLGTCYGTIPDSSTMAQVVKDDKGFLGFNVNPMSYSGTLVAKFYVFEAGKFSDGDTCTFIINAETSGLSTIALESGVNLYPNPTRDNLSIGLANNTSSQIKISSTSGQVIKELTTDKSIENIDVSAFESGVYIIRVTQNDKTGFYKFIKS